ncbi:hypothetical protein CR513_47814, partial [Mucuna pruriens]
MIGAQLEEYITNPKSWLESFFLLIILVLLYSLNPYHQKRRKSRKEESKEENLDFFISQVYQETPKNLKNSRYGEIICSQFIEFSCIVYSHVSSVLTFNGLNFSYLNMQVQFHLDILDLDLALLEEKLVVITYSSSNGNEEKAHYKS